MRNHRLGWLLVFGLIAVVGVTWMPREAAVQAQANSAQQLVQDAAAALGGRTRLLAVRDLRIEGYGQIGSQNGGGNISADPNAPQKWINYMGHIRHIDFVNERMRTVQTQTHDFVFAYERNMRGVPGAVQGLDRDVAYNIAPNGMATRVNGEAALRQRRIEMLNNPISIIRMALNQATRFGTPRLEGTYTLLNMTTPANDEVAVGFDNATKRPYFLEWLQGDTNLGDVQMRTYYTAYQPINGVQVPFGYQTVMDWRNTIVNKLMVDRTIVDSEIPAGSPLDLAAPASVRTPPAAAPAPQQNAAVQVTNVAPHVWYIRGAGNSTAFEFDDHITLFEVYASEANALNIINAARRLVPGKPVTQVIVSHHHFDHSGGLRAAVSEGLQIITARGNVDIFRDMATRPARAFPDALGRNPRPINILPVDDRLVLKDNTNEVHVLRAINNSHMADAVIAWQPAARLIAEGDMVDQAWDVVWWGNSFPETVRFWNLNPARDLAVHGDNNTWEQSLANLRRQAAQAKALCDAVKAANFNMPGCPLTNIGF
jgi:hypothetical protein